MVDVSGAPAPSSAPAEEAIKRPPRGPRRRYYENDDDNDDEDDEDGDGDGDGDEYEGKEEEEKEEQEKKKKDDAEQKKYYSLMRGLLPVLKITATPLANKLDIIINAIAQRDAYPNRASLHAPNDLVFAQMDKGENKILLSEWLQAFILWFSTDKIGPQQRLSDGPYFTDIVHFIHGMSELDLAEAPEKKGALQTFLENYAKGNSEEINHIKHNLERAPKKSQPQAGSPPPPAKPEAGSPLPPAPGSGSPLPPAQGSGAPKPAAKPEAPTTKTVDELLKASIPAELDKAKDLANEFLTAIQSHSNYTPKIQNETNLGIECFTAKFGKSGRIGFPQSVTKLSEFISVAFPPTIKAYDNINGLSQLINVLKAILEAVNATEKTFTERFSAAKSKYDVKCPTVKLQPGGARTTKKKTKTSKTSATHRFRTSRKAH